MGASAGRLPIMSNGTYPFCSFIAATSTNEAACVPRSIVLSTIKQTKAMSAWAKSIVQGASASFECGKHNTSADCWADLKNYCGWSGTRCSSGLGKRLLVKSLCPDAIYTKSENCLSKRRDECGAGADRSQPDAEGCVVSDWGAYWGKSQYQAYGPADEARLGGPNMFGVCMLAEELPARLGSDNEYNRTSYEAWNRYVGGDANNVTDFLRARGNCSYSQNAVARNVYSAQCLYTNDIYADANNTFKSLNTSSAAAMACAANGCAQNVYNGTRSTARYAANKLQGMIGTVYTVCETDSTYLWSTRLNPKTDRQVYAMYQLCYSPYLQRNKALCEGAVLEAAYS
ncbi:hypothetical protein HYH02_004369 [Chlamydomonas schloesseri]|uniref:Uncharacterized protein n=1 Tax=Chlamydomonas schloesseri TaxID=2026947 RepID=A0A836B8R5_9CHLO|nr:hypothetical protein HYH02_004369 [Chlamydomonas schloesseri]|eukprot:KAG2451101.1 hypothetical protein HYH02_004369 [Chlamydomonas schloesseri]